MLPKSDKPPYKKRHRLQMPPVDGEKMKMKYVTCQLREERGFYWFRLFSLQGFFYKRDFPEKW